MMRLLDWLRGSRLSDDLDVELTTLFARDSQDAPSPAQLARARVRVDARLREDERSGSLLRRLALAAVGGGSMWTGLIGIAAAHKAVAVTAGLGLVFGGSVAAEASGVGSAVRTAVTSAVQAEQGTPEADLLALEQDEDVEATAAVDASETTGHEQCFAATEHARSVLSAHFDGSFFTELDLPEQAKAGLNAEGRAQVENALAALEDCGLGNDESEAATADEDARQGPPAGVPQGPSADAPQGPPAGVGTEGANLNAQLDADVETDLEDDAEAGAGLGLSVGVGQRPSGAGQPEGPGQP